MTIRRSFTGGHLGVATTAAMCAGTDLGTEQP
jgi:hypothetical protein